MVLSTVGHIVLHQVKQNNTWFIVRSDFLGVSLVQRVRFRRWVRDIATREFSPQHAHRIRRLLYHPLNVFVAAGLASFVCGLFLNAQGFMLCGALLSVVALGVFLPWLQLKGLQARLSYAQEKASEGDIVEICLTLRNRMPWGARGVFFCHAATNDIHPDRVAIDVIPARHTVDCRWDFSPPSRGVYPVTPQRLATGFPFGLCEFGNTVPVERALTVWPKVYPVGPMPPVSGENRIEGNVSRAKVGTNGDVMGVRPYRRGDSPRRIHWGQSARQDRLIVCEIESNSRPVIQLILDTDPQVHSGVGRDSTLEWAIRIVGSFAQGWLDHGAQVGVSWAHQEISPASGRSQAIKILDALAAISPENSPPLSHILECPVCRNFREGLQIIVTTDRVHAHDGCALCETENQRWVILKTGRFAGETRSASCGHCPDPWLELDTPEEIPAALRGKWREARHGS